MQLHTDRISADSDRRSQIGLRNVLVHGYAGLDNAQIWRMLHEHLPDLQAAVTRLLEESGPAPTV